MSAIAMTTDRDTLELLAQMTPHGPSMIGGRGGIDRLTALDIAAAVGMARLDTLSELLVLVHHADMQALRPRLVTQWYLALIDVALSEGWTVERGMPRIRALARITMHEHLEPSWCRRCNGTGIHTNQRECATCGGSRHAPIATQDDYCEALTVELEAQA